MKKEVKRTEKGWAGHFICADQCLFRRHTMVELGDICISISTVGNWRPGYRDDRRMEMVGSGRYFETMVFHSLPATEENPWKDADVKRYIDFDSLGAIDEPWKEQEANDMHEAVVAEITVGLLAGNKYENAE